jgi:phage shock protein PspC (stress-responsive transcriptional regulator)
MRQIITVSFDNAIFQLDEEAYGALRRYLDRARAGLAGNPDVNEILGDLERSIAEKCISLAKAGKAILQPEDIKEILDEMGPVVEDPAAETHQNWPSSGVDGPTAPRKLYKQPIGAKLSGVCSGLAEYFGADVVLVRIIFLVLALVGGAGLIAYLILELLMPSRDPQAARPLKVLKAFLFAVALVSLYALATVRQRYVFGVRPSEVLMISAMILMYAIPYVIVVASILLVAVAAAKYLRSGPRV